MSQKVHPKGFRLRSTGHLDSLTSPLAGNSESSILAWDSVWFSEPKKGKHFYTRILHEDQLIQDYTKGFFRSFGFYQQKCVIERKCNKEYHITSYVLRSPKLQPSKLDTLGTRTRQEKVLQEGLQQGWVPFLIQSVISKILYEKSKRLHVFSKRKTAGSFPSKVKGRSYHVRRRTQVISNWKFQPTPSLSAILTPQENSKSQVFTNQKRFQDFWNCWVLGKEKGFWSQGKHSDNYSIHSSSNVSGGTLNPWWTHRSWNSIVLHPTMSSILQTNEVCSGTPTEYSSNNHSSFPKTPFSGYEVLGSDSDASQLKITYSIQPVKSLISSSELIVDYMADKIEQSVSIQQIFNELLRFFETEAVCVGPSFLTDNKSVGSTDAKSEIEYSAGVPEVPKELWKESASNFEESWETSGASQMPQSKIVDAALRERPTILGFRIVCSGRLQISSFSKPAEKAESIEITRGVLPLNSFQANIDFAQTYATNAYGTCGIKVWVNRG